VSLCVLSLIFGLDCVMRQAWNALKKALPLKEAAKERNAVSPAHLAHMQDVISQAVAGFSIEVTPQAAAKVKTFKDLLPVGTSVNVTFLPGSDIADTISVCERIHEAGLKPVPHVAARSLQSEKHLDEYLDGLTSRASVEEILVIGGGVVAPLGPFHESMQVLESGALQRYGIRRVGLAAHPEGSPDIDDDSLIDALKRKNAWAAAHNESIEAYLETQFCFDPAVVVAWEQRMASIAGNQLPVCVGIAGPSKLSTLLKFAQMSGVGPSIHMLTRQTSSVVKLAMNKVAPDGIISSLAEHVVSDSSKLSHFHFYCFGGFSPTAKWALKVAEGNIEFQDGCTDSFRVAQKPT